MKPAPQQQGSALSRGNCVAHLLDREPVECNSALIGRAAIFFRGGWGVPNVPVFRRADGSLTVGAPSTPIVNADGMQLRDDDGKRRYAPAIFFADREARQRWSRAILAALAEAGIGGSAP